MELYPPSSSGKDPTKKQYASIKLMDLRFVHFVTKELALSERPGKVLQFC